MSNTPEVIEDDPIEVRRAKREALIAAGIDPYGHSVKRSHTVGELNEKYAHLEDGESTEDAVLIAGRVMAKRVQGKIAFLELRESGCDIQLFCRINALGEEAFAALCDLDVGDWIAVHGTMMRTKRGQLSVAVDSFELMSKSLRPLPEKFHGLTDKETRYRQRYVDLVMNPEVRTTFERRFKIVSAIRRYMEGQGYYEVETPFLHAIIGGAKISDKIQVIANLMEKADVILIGGGMANTFVAAEGYDMGKSLQDKDRFDLARNLMKKAHDMGSEIMLPVDFMAGDAFAEDANTKVLSKEEFQDPWMALDIGPKTIELYVETLKKMKTVVWNGPMGVFEMKPFSKGTFTIARAMADLDATTVIGGGESASVVDELGLGDKFSHVSTGGGASLEMLEGMVLPGVAILADKE